MSEVVWGAVVVAGGVGSRFGAGIPKQFVDLGGRKLIDWSLDTFRKTGRIRELAVVLPREENLWKEFWSPPGDLLLTGGGKRRQARCR
jgi:2-C-methyl-D-erythritol 4-phosphate cytidylyltransferase